MIWLSYSHPQGGKDTTGKKLTTDLFINNGTLDFANESITIDHIDLILSGINAH